MEDKLIQSAQEINKGNEIIKQLQTDLKTIKQKAKTKENLSIQQEQLIVQDKKTIEECMRQLEATKRETSNKVEELKLEKNKVNDLKGKLEVSQKMLESNETIKS